MLHYTKYEHPMSRDWVTFIHGAGGSSSIWFKQIKDFKNDFNVLLIDLRGHGKSKDHKYEVLKKYSFESIGNEVIQVLDHLQIAKSHFVGISLGTIIIRELSERHPDRLASMILAGAVMKLNIKGQILMKIGNTLKSLLPYMLLYRIFAFVILPKSKHKASRILFINEAKKLYQKEFGRWFSLVSEVNPLLRFFRLKETQIPTLYVMGAEDHMFLPSIKKLVEKQKTALLKIVENSGHVVNVDQPASFNSISISFLKNETALLA
jgi:pimeloyl-ACP methyl ester carboxylesterase